MAEHALWHASEDPAITLFTPHRAPTALTEEELVWAIDDEHVPSYWFPRDCPRATFWSGPGTTSADAELLYGARRVHAIEWDWWDRLREARLFLYRLPPEPFEPHDETAGYWVAQGAGPAARPDRAHRPRRGAREGPDRAAADGEPLAALGPRHRNDAPLQRHPPAQRAAARVGFAAVRVHVAFTPAEEAAAPVGIVVDVIRATSSIAQALAAGYDRVLCCGEIEEARALREELGDEAIVGGERLAVVVPGFDVGASPRDFLEPQARTLILTTTNGTQAILTAAQRCQTVLLGSLLNLGAVAGAAAGRDTAIVCSGFQGAFALDDAYCAGRIVERLGVRNAAERSDAAIAASLIADAYPDALAGLRARTYGPPGLDADIEYCAQVDLLDVVPRFSRMVGPAAEIVA